jgi:hypothetical protein
LLVLRGQTLVALPFNPQSTGITGEGIPVADHVAFNTNTRLTIVSASENGTLMYQSGDDTAPDESLGWFTWASVYECFLPSRGRITPYRKCPRQKAAETTPQVGTRIAHEGKPRYAWLASLISAEELAESVYCFCSVRESFKPNS